MLVTMDQILKKANEGNYAVLATNAISEFDARAYVEVAEEMKSPIILEVAVPLAAADTVTIGRAFAEIAAKSSVPVAVHLDHGKDLNEIMQAVRGGFTSVMLDRSSAPYEENVTQVKAVVDLVKPLGISVEAELGHVGQGADYEGNQSQMLTDPIQAKRFIEATGISALAVAIGTAHGAYRGTPHIDFDRLKAIKEETDGFPLVLHGCSGTGDENLHKACMMGINKVNMFNDLLKAAYERIINTDLSGDGAYFLFKTAKEAMQDTVRKNILIVGSEGKAL